VRDIQQTSQEVTALLRAADNLRETQDDNAQLVKLAMDDSALVALAKELALAQGDVLDDARLEEALEEVKKQRYRFQPAADSVALDMARRWATRDQWGPKWRMRGLFAGALALVVAVSTTGISLSRHASWDNDMAASLQRQNQLQANVAQQKAKLAAVDLEGAREQVVASYENAKAQLRQAEAGLATLASQSVNEQQRDALYEQDADKARALLEQRTQQLARVETFSKNTETAVVGAESLKEAYAQASSFDMPVPATLENLRNPQRAAFNDAAQRGDYKGMYASVGTLRKAVDLTTQAKMVASQLDHLSPAARQKVQERLDTVANTLQLGGVDQASTLLGDTRALIAQASLGYTLKIVSGGGPQTAVWRHYNNNGNKTFYILVDAIGMDGKPVELPITSIEDKSTRNVSRFGVRVDEATYNRIGKDKTDNGIVDNDLMATKAVGDLEAQYAFPVVGGAITEW
jgi:hypothetical protein